MMRRLQAIDIGTNSVRSIVVELAPGVPFRVIDDEKETTRLGQGLDATGMLAAEAMERTISALKAYVGIGRNLGADRVRTIATAAVRMACNGSAFVDRIREEVGIDVEVVSEEEEGRLVFLSAAANFALSGRSAVIDIGGGSVEVVQAIGRRVEHVVSMPLGARVLTERFVDGDPVTDEGFKRMKRYVRRLLREGVGEHPEAAQVLVGSGGTLSSAAAITAAAQDRRYDSLQGFEVTRPEVMRLLADLSRMNAGERRKMPGLPPERVDVILAGTLVLAEAMKLLGATSVFVNARGIREGIVIDTIEHERDVEAAVDPLKGVREFGEQCRYDPRHAEQVARLALSLFDQLADLHGLGEHERRLLEASAMLHDVGYYIAYDRHHKHAYHLILNASLPGFTHRDVRRIAAVARYHTKALPKASQESWADLDAEDRAVVERLAAILRLADGLDRGRGAHVREVRALHDGHALRLIVRGEGELHPEFYGVQKKKDLFEKTFAVPVEPRIASEA